MIIKPVFFLVSPFRQSSESGGPLPPDPDCACEDDKKCGGVPPREVPVYRPAGHRHPQRESGHSAGKHESAGVQVSGQHVNQTRKERDTKECFTDLLMRHKESSQ